MAPLSETKKWIEEENKKIVLVTSKDKRPDYNAAYKAHPLFFVMQGRSTVYTRAHAELEEELIDDPYWLARLTSINNHHSAGSTHT